MNREQTNSGSFLSLALKTSIGIILLLIVWAVVVSLPMLREIRTPLPFTLDELFGAIMLTVLVVVLLRFSKTLGEYLSCIFPKFQQLGEVSAKVILLISVLILYYAYNPLIIPYLIYFGDLQWIYHVLFLVIFLIVLGKTAIILYNNSDNIASLFNSSKIDELVSRSNPICSSCEKENDAGALFCSACGKLLPQPCKCYRCEAAIRDTDLFCMNCGASREDQPNQATQDSSETQSEMSDQPKPDLQITPTNAVVDSNVRNCPFCNEEVNAKAIKCKHCKSDIVNS